VTGEEDLVGAYGAVYLLFFTQRREGRKGAEGRGRKEEENGRSREMY